MPQTAPRPDQDRGQEPVPDQAGPDKRQRLVSHLLIAVLCLSLGFAIIIQVRRTQDGDALSTARPQDLVAILDGVQRREDELMAEIADLSESLNTLRRGGASSAQALAEAQRRASTLGILAGTAAATGPGIVLTLADPESAITPEVLLGALQELRNAGAEAVQVGQVRIGVESAFTGQAGGILVDGTPISAPYVIRAIGDPPTLSAAMNIPGGVGDTVRRANGTMDLTQSDSMTISVLRPVRTPTFARPVG
ncbi:DUF881 domain-containing protein [Nakamurella silvestris]|nr:DUF881 domain-containing protein [Nakamurella silvestris]